VTVQVLCCNVTAEALFWNVAVEALCWLVNSSFMLEDYSNSTVQEMLFFFLDYIEATAT